MSCSRRSTRGKASLPGGSGSRCSAREHSGSTARAPPLASPVARRRGWALRGGGPQSGPRGPAQPFCRASVPAVLHLRGDGIPFHQGGLRGVPAARPAPRAPSRWLSPCCPGAPCAVAALPESPEALRQTEAPPRAWAGGGCRPRPPRRVLESCWPRQVHSAGELLGRH